MRLSCLYRLSLYRTADKHPLSEKLPLKAPPVVLLQPAPWVWRDAGQFEKGCSRPAPSKKDLDLEIQGSPVVQLQIKGKLEV